MRTPLTLLALVSFAAAADRPNVLLICVDDLKPSIGCFGDPLAKTPNIDRLAKHGVVFRSAFANQAVCAPSRNALMTGLRPDQIGIYDLQTWFRHSIRDAVTLSQRFMQNGYRAESLGKIFHRGHGNVIDPASWSVRFWYPTGGSPTPVTTGGPKPPAGSKKKPGGKSSAKLPVHSVDEVLPKGAPEFAGHNSGELRAYSDIQAVGPLTAEQARTMVHGYYASTAFVDAQIGSVLDTLDHLDLWKNTIVVLWGDHGWHLGDHGLWCKHTNFEQAAHNPVIICALGKSAGKETRSLMQTVDIYPTLCALAGIAPPQGLAGKSLVPILENPATSIQDAVFHVFPRGGGNGIGEMLGRAVRTSRWRYVEWRSFKDDVVRGRELYDYETDPDETENRADRPEHAALVKELAARLVAIGPAKKPVKKDPTLIEPDDAH